MANIKNLTLGAGIALAGIVLPASLYAGTESKAVVETTTKSALSGDLGINFVSEYISRGAPQEIKGVIAEPYADIAYSVYEGDGFVNKASLVLGLWSSFHSTHTLAPANARVPAWYEFDWTPGVSVTFAKNYTLTASYFEFDSPSGAFDASRNLNFNLAYDDTSLLGKFALHPHVTYLRELVGKAATGPGGLEGNYYEAGIAPALPAYGPVTLSFPMIVGFGSAHFYAENKAYGYFSGGVAAAVALPIPAKYGAWSFNTSAIYYNLADQNAYVYSTDNTINRNRVVFSGGIGATF